MRRQVLYNDYMDVQDQRKKDALVENVLALRAMFFQLREDDLEARVLADLINEMSWDAMELGATAFELTPGPVTLGV